MVKYSCYELLNTSIVSSLDYNLLVIIKGVKFHLTQQNLREWHPTSNMIISGYVDHSHLNHDIGLPRDYLKGHSQFLQKAKPNQLINVFWAYCYSFLTTTVLFATRHTCSVFTQVDCDWVSCFYRTSSCTSFLMHVICLSVPSMGSKQGICVENHRSPCNVQRCCLDSPHYWSNPVLEYGHQLHLSFGDGGLVLNKVWT